MSIHNSREHSADPFSDIGYDTQYINGERQHIDFSEIDNQKLYCSNIKINGDADLSQEDWTAILLKGTTVDGKVDASNIEVDYFGILDGEIEEVDLSGSSINHLYDNSPCTREYITDEETEVRSIGKAGASTLNPSEAAYWKDCMNLDLKYDLGGLKADTKWPMPDIVSTVYVGKD